MSSIFLTRYRFFSFGRIPCALLRLFCAETEHFVLTPPSRTIFLPRRRWHRLAGCLSVGQIRHSVTFCFDLWSQLPLHPWIETGTLPTFPIAYTSLALPASPPCSGALAQVWIPTPAQCTAAFTSSSSLTRRNLLRVGALGASPPNRNSSAWNSG